MRWSREIIFYIWTIVCSEVEFCILAYKQTNIHLTHSPKLAHRIFISIWILCTHCTMYTHTQPARILQMTKYTLFVDCCLFLICCNTIHSPFFLFRLPKKNHCTLFSFFCFFLLLCCRLQITVSDTRSKHSTSTLCTKMMNDGRNDGKNHKRTKRK